MDERGESDADRQSVRHPSSTDPARDRRAQREQAGLCADCAHSRRVEAKRETIFYLCGLSATDPAFPKYPALPVLECSGYAAKD
jgi:hypothetical protein